MLVEEFWDGTLNDDDRTMVENHILNCRTCARDFVLRRQLEETPKAVWMGGLTRMASAVVIHECDDAR